MQSGSGRSLCCVLQWTRPRRCFYWRSDSESSGAVGAIQAAEHQCGSEFVPNQSDSTTPHCFYKRHFKATREICSYTILLFLSLLVFLLGWCLLFDCGMTCSALWAADRDTRLLFRNVLWAEPPVYIWLVPLYNLLLKPDWLLWARPPGPVSYLVPHNGTFLILKLQIWIFKNECLRLRRGNTCALFKIRKRLVEKTAPLSFLRNTVATFYIRHTFTSAFIVCSGFVTWRVKLGLLGLSPVSAHIVFNLELSPVSLQLTLRWISGSTLTPCCVGEILQQMGGEKEIFIYILKPLLQITRKIRERKKYIFLRENKRVKLCRTCTVTI